MKTMCMVWWLLLLFVLVNSQCVVRESTTRLPSFIVPSHYSLHYVVPSPETPSIVNSNSASFQGNVTISLQIQQTTTCIALHSALLSLSSISLLTGINGQITTPNATQYLAAAQITVLHFAQALEPQLAQLIIAFSGNFNNQSASGFFLSDNVFDPAALEVERKVEAFQRRSASQNRSIPSIGSGKLKLTAGVPKMYATQFESNAARYAYPSFDEPEFKAIFTTTITVTYDSSSDNTTVLFNTPLASRQTGPGYYSFTFEPSPHPMSTYLLAIAVGSFEYVETTNDKGQVFRIYTPPGASQYATFALNVTKNVVAYFSDIWSFDYFSMMPKMDQISVPAIIEDAMENWGLLTYYPEFLLVDAENPKTPLPALQIITLVVVHEISHQWFGDTVTTPWWNQIFLNEGYARFLQFVGTDYLFPEWQIYTQGGDNSYYNFAYLPALQADFMGLAPPIVNFSQTSGLPNVDSDDFGIISYGKGAAINRMIASYLTLPVWNQVMAYHLQKHQYTNPSILDLMESYDSYLGTSISNQLYPYFIYSGFPVLTISINDTTVSIEQSPISEFGNPNPNPYWVHANLQFSDAATGISTNVIADFSTVSTSLRLPQSGSWTILPDLNITSYALFNYDPVTWNQIIAQIMTIPDLNRQHIIQSQFMLLQMAYLDPKIASQTTLALSASLTPLSEAYPLYQTIFSNWLSLSSLFQYSETVYTNVFGDLAKSVSILTQRVGLYPNAQDDANTRALRGLALFCAARFNASDVVADELFLWRTGYKLSEEQKKGVYWAVVRFDPSGYDSILQMYQQSNQTDKSTLLFALLGPANTAQCQNTIVLITDNNSTSISQQLNLLSQMMWNNFECRQVAWTAFKSLAEKGWQLHGKSLTSTIVQGFNGLFATAEDLGDVKSFVATNQKYFSDSQITSIFVRIQINIQVVDKWG